MSVVSKNPFDIFGGMSCQPFHSTQVLLTLVQTTEGSLQLPPLPLRRLPHPLPRLPTHLPDPFQAQLQLPEVETLVVDEEGETTPLEVDGP
jgi:hypothetical protein